MASLRLKIDNKALGRAMLQAQGTRAEVARHTRAAAARARALTDDEIVDAPEQGRSRARGYVRRLGSGAAGEAADGALSRSV